MPKKNYDSIFSLEGKKPQTKADITGTRTQSQVAAIKATGVQQR